MGRDEDKLIRQLSLLSFLLSQTRPCTAREIQDSVEGYYDMTDDTFARRFHGDRADLAKIGIEIRCLTGTEKDDTQAYLLPEENYRLPVLEFTAAEQRALALALAALDGRFAYARPLRLALTAISQGQANPIRDELEQLPIALAPDEDAQRAGKQLARLEEAVTRGKTVRFSYPSAKGSCEQRTLDPYSLFLIQGRWYVVGLDHLRGAIRTFRVARIRSSVHFLTEKSRDFSVPDDYDPAEYRARAPWMIGPVQGTAVIGVDEALAWWALRLQPHVQRVRSNPDGCTYFTTPYADEEVLLSWVVGLGGLGELVEPEDMRERLHRRLMDVCRAHDGETLAGSTGSMDAQYSASPRRSAGAAHSTAPRRALSEGKTDPIAPEHLARAIVLLQYLADERRPELVTWQALTEDLGLTREEIEPDLSLINLVNFGGGTYALAAEAHDEGVRVTRDVMAEAFAHPARLSPLMARALVLALDLLGDACTLDGAESLAAVREKVGRLVGDTPPGSSIVVDDVIPVSHDVMEVLNHCVRNRLLVDIEYFSPLRGELASRRVEPYLLYRSRDGWYLEAFCLKAGAQRTFKVDLIRSVKPSAETFPKRSDVDLTLCRSGVAFSPDSAVSWADIRFSPRWRTYLEDRRIQFNTLEDGNLRARMPYQDERWIARETVRFLGGAVLEQPSSARAKVRELAASLAHRYSSDRPFRHDSDRP